MVDIRHDIYFLNEKESNRSNPRQWAGVINDFDLINSRSVDFFHDLGSWHSSGLVVGMTERGDRGWCEETCGEWGWGYHQDKLI